MITFIPPILRLLSWGVPCFWLHLYLQKSNFQFERSLWYSFSYHFAFRIPSANMAQYHIRFILKNFCRCNFHCYCKLQWTLFTLKKNRLIKWIWNFIVKWNGYHWCNQSHRYTIEIKYIADSILISLFFLFIDKFEFNFLKN